MSRRKITYTILAAVVLLLSVFAFWSFFAETSDNGFSLHIRKGESYDTLRSELRGHIRHFWAFNLYCSYINLDKRFKGGFYQFSPSDNVRDIAKRIAIGAQDQIKLIISPKRTSREMAGLIAKQIEADSVEVLHALCDKKNGSELFSGCDSLFSYIISDTYFVFWNTPADELVQRLTFESSRFFSQKRQQKAKTMKLNPQEIFILASIVQEETARKEDMPIIAGVYLNRLRQGILLQSCPTVRYALQDFSIKRILNKHLRYESSYNTYLYRGLPPTPICSPVKQALDAVLNYTEHDFMYFCADAHHPGHTIFSKTFNEHKRLSNNFRRKLDKLKIYK
ncbi:MAG: endolytic transglycosylase MltG [Alistipes sp.]|nr:endolytic transglycosylase MltG [Candidatus Alistipes equi]